MAGLQQSLPLFTGSMIMPTATTDKADNQTETLLVDLTPAEFQQIEEVATRYNLTHSDVITQSVRQACENDETEARITLLNHIHWQECIKLDRIATWWNQTEQAVLEKLISDTDRSILEKLKAGQQRAYLEGSTTTKEETAR